MPEKCIDICIIGGGASGMIAAIAAKKQNPGASVLLLEKKERLGSKLLATGNGRCNLTNALCGNTEEILEFFRGIGILTREEEQGRIYPYDGKAASVLEAFLFHIASSCITAWTSFAVAEAVSCSKKGFLVRGSGGEIMARSLLLATGGKAGPQFGCSGDGYKIARAFGHQVTKTAPVLTPLECEGDFSKLKGLRAKAKATLLKRGEAIAAEEGEVQFTEYGLSGICVFNLSRFVKLAGCEFSDYQVSVDLAYDISEDALLRELTFREGILPRDKRLLSIVAGPFTETLLGVDAERTAMNIKNVTYQVKNAKGWQFAQCTSGGIALGEIETKTMESLLVKGLFFSGEVIDYDGPCGGYNLHNAWDTGLRAGRAMAEYVQNS